MTLIVSNSDAKSENDSVKENISSENVTSSIFMGQGPVLRNWKILADDQDMSVNENQEIRGFSDRQINLNNNSSQPMWLQITQSIAVFLTVAWVTYVALYIISLPNEAKNVVSSPFSLGVFLASVLAPIAMMWLCIASWQRRNEANLYSVALKQELQNLLFPNADEQNLLSENIRVLMRQATEMSSSSRAAIKAMQRARAGLHEELQNFANLTQKAEVNIDRMTENLGKSSGELLSLTETIEAQSTVIADKAQRGVLSWENVSAEISELTEEIDDLFDKGKEKLIVAANETTQKINIVKDDMFSAMENLSAKISGVAQTINVTGTQVDKHAEELSRAASLIAVGTEKLDSSINGITNVSNTVENIMNVMSSALNNADERSVELLNQTNLVERKLENRTEILNVSANKLIESTNNLQNIGDVATTKFAGALSMVKSGAEEINGLVENICGGIENSINNATNQINQSINTTDSKVEEMLNATEKHRAQLNQLLSEIELSKGKVEKSITELIETENNIIDATNAAQNTLSTATVKMLERSQDPIKLINQSIDRLENYTQDFDERLTVRVINVDQETNKLKTIIEEVSSTFAGNIEKIIGTAGQMKTQSQQIDDELVLQRATLQLMLNDIEKTAIEIDTIIKARQEILNDAIDASENRINLIGDKFTGRGQELLGQINKAADSVIINEDKIISAFQLIDQSAIKAELTITAAVDTIDKMTQKIEPQCNLFINKADLLNNRYNELQQNMVATSDMALNCMNEMGETLDQRFERIGTRTIATSKTIMDLSDNLTESMRNIRDVSETAHDRISVVYSDIKNNATDLQTITEQINVKFTGLNNNLELHIRDLGDVVESAISNLSNAVDEFGLSNNVLESSTESTIYKLNLCAEKYNDMGDVLSIRAHEIDMINDSSTRLVAKLSEIGIGAGNAVARIDDARQNLSVIGDKLQNYANSAITAADEAGQVFSRHSTSLYKSVSEMAEQAKTFRDKHIRVEREAFLSSAKFVIEGLYSLAIDVSRHVEEKTDSRIMKAYQKGDASAYARHLIEILPKIPIEKAQRKFMEDSEFRIYVLRFIRQFEELLEQSQENDYADLLSSVFATSDIGKLYKSLCEIAGRNLREH